jgi:hypothetical protein
MLRLWVALCFTEMVKTLSAAVRRTCCWQWFRVDPTHFRRKIVYGARDHVSQKLSAPATTVSLNRLAVATMRRYSPPRTGKKKEAVTCTFISTGRESPAPLQLPRAVLTVVT